MDVALGPNHIDVVLELHPRISECRWLVHFFSLFEFSSLRTESVAGRRAFALCQAISEDENLVLVDLVGLTQVSSRPDCVCVVDKCPGVFLDIVRLNLVER